MPTRPFGFSHCAVFTTNKGYVFMKRDTAKETFNRMSTEHPSKYYPYQLINIDKDNSLNPTYRFKKGGEIAPIPEPVQPSNKSSTQVLIEGLKDLFIDTAKAYIKNGFKMPEPKPKRYRLPKSIRDAIKESKQTGGDGKFVHYPKWIDASIAENINKLIEFSGNRYGSFAALAYRSYRYYHYVQVQGAKFFFNIDIMDSIKYHNWENKHLTNKLYYEYNSMIDGIIPRHRALLEVMRRYGAYYDNEDGLFKGYDEAEFPTPEVFAQEVERYALDHP